MARHLILNETFQSVVFETSEQMAMSFFNEIPSERFSSLMLSKSEKWSAKLSTSGKTEAEVVAEVDNKLRGQDLAAFDLYVHVCMYCQHAVNAVSAHSCDPRFPKVFKDFQLSGPSVGKFIHSTFDVHTKEYKEFQQGHDAIKSAILSKRTNEIKARDLYLPFPLY